MSAAVSRRALVAGMAASPLAGVAVAAPIAFRAPVNADEALIAACSELLKLKDWVNDPAFPDGDEAIDAALDRDGELCALIFRTPARTRLGLMWKARVTIRENGLNEFVNWDGVRPLPEYDTHRLLISLVNDVMHTPEVA